MTEPKAAPSGLDQLDPLLHHRSRLGVLVMLSTIDALSFTRLRVMLGETDGNLGAQLRKLEDSGYVSVEKEFVERRPLTWYSLTRKGRAALARHLSGMEALIKAAGNGGS